MAIEIRELVIKATVVKDLREKEQYVSRRELDKMRKRILDECMERLRDQLEELRSGR